MNSQFSTTNLGLFTLERCHDYNSANWNAWRVRAHSIFGWRAIWGTWQFTRISAVLIWLGLVWEDCHRQPAPIVPFGWIIRDCGHTETQQPPTPPVRWSGPRV